jgi:hypothetical protein
MFPGRPWRKAFCYHSGGLWKLWSEFRYLFSLTRIHARHENVVKFFETEEKLPEEKAFMYPSQEWKKDMPIFVLKDNGQEKSRWSSQGGQGQLISLSKKDIFFSFFFYYSYVHTRLGSFLPPAPTPSLTTHSTPSRSPPQYPAETILPLSLILL